MAVEEIADVSGYSSRQLHRWFDEYLDEYPTWHIKDQLRLHRGLSETRVDNFIKWYLYFNDEKKAKK